MAPSYGKQDSVQAGMESMGFTKFAEANQKDLIIYTGDMFGENAYSIADCEWTDTSRCNFPMPAYNHGGDSGKMGWITSFTYLVGGLCLLDTSGPDWDYLTPACGFGDTSIYGGATGLMQNETHTSGKGTTRTQSNWTQSQSSDPAYYVGKLYSSGGTGHPVNNFVLQGAKAGWMFTQTQDATTEYRWPVSDLDPKRTCTVGPSSPTDSTPINGRNVNGVPSMCDDALVNHWVYEWLPAKPGS